MARIAPRRTGVVIFGARVLSIFTGLLFTIMVTHSLSTDQWGLLEVISDLVAFSTIPLSAVNFWVTRETGRGKPVAKTAVIANLGLSLLGVVVFVLLAFIKQSLLTASLELLGFSLILVPVSYFYSTTNAILSAHYPQALGYVLLASEVTKVALAYVLLFVLKTQLVGVLVAISASNVVLGVGAAYFAKDTFSGPYSFGQWKGWFRDSWLPALNSIPYVIGIADTFAAFVIAGSTLVGYYQAAFAIAGIVGYCSYLTYALYPMLLRGASERLIGTLFDLMMLFGVPMAVGAAALSPQLLFLLSRGYVNMAVPLMILSFAVLLGTGSSVFDSALTGMETADLAESDRVGAMLRSNLFFVPKVNLVWSFIYIVVIAAIVYVGVMEGQAVVTITTYWAAAQLVLYLGLFLVKLNRLGLAAFRGMRRQLSFYALCSAAMGIFVYAIAGELLSFGMTALAFGVRLAATIGLGGVAYFGLLAILDRRSRDRLARIAGMLLSRRPSPGQDLRQQARQPG